MINSTRVAGKPRRLSRYAFAMAGAVLLAWSCAGFFMGGDDELEGRVPLLVVLGGGFFAEREKLACELYAQGHGRQGVVLTGGNFLTLLGNRNEIVKGCGIPAAVLQEWPDTANTYEEMVVLSTMLQANPGMQAVVVSYSLHISRLRFLRDKLGMNGRIFFRASPLAEYRNYDYLNCVVRFWFREPLAYLVYRFKY